MKKNKIINEEILNIVNRYIKEVNKYYKVEAIYLFGSYAKGTEHEDSDIDIAVITSDFNNDIFDEQLKLKKLRWNIDLRIEPHIIKTEDYKNIRTPFIKEVIDTGIKLT